jgi:heterodisulfide reductase subunit B
MRYAFFPGCLVQTEQYGYELSVREVLPRLGVELVELQGKSCCGYPSFSVTSPLIWTYLSARNLSLGERLGADILTLCNNCHLSFCENKMKLEADSFLKNVIDQTLLGEELEYKGECGIVHLLEVLHDCIGVEKISEAVIKPLRGIKVAPHPGCHAFRPSDIERPDKGEDPRKLDELIQALGAETFDYPERLNCCGSSVSIYDEGTALSIASEKLRAVKDNGFDALSTSCPHCFRILDGKQPLIRSQMGDEAIEIPVFYYTQLLGLSMGISPERLGLQMNLSPIRSVLERIIED